MEYRRKPTVIEAVTFEEFVEHGKRAASSLVNGVPWHFDYAGHPVTHEDDDCYIIPTNHGYVKFHRGDMLITGPTGEIYPCQQDIFAATYEATG